MEHILADSPDLHRVRNVFVVKVLRPPSALPQACRAGFVNSALSSGFAWYSKPTGFKRLKR